MGKGKAKTLKAGAVPVRAKKTRAQIDQDKELAALNALSIRTAEVDGDSEGILIAVTKIRDGSLALYGLMTKAAGSDQASAEQQAEIAAISHVELSEELSAQLDEVPDENVIPLIRTIGSRLSAATLALANRNQDEKEPVVVMESTAVEGAVEITSKSTVSVENCTKLLCPCVALPYVDEDTQLKLIIMNRRNLTVNSLEALTAEEEAELAALSAEGNDGDVESSDHEDSGDEKEMKRRAAAGMKKVLQPTSKLTAGTDPRRSHTGGLQKLDASGKRPGTPPVEEVSFMTAGGELVYTQDKNARLNVYIRHNATRDFATYCLNLEAELKGVDRTLTALALGILFVPWMHVPFVHFMNGHVGRRLNATCLQVRFDGLRGTGAYGGYGYGGGYEALKKMITKKRGFTMEDTDNVAFEVLVQGVSIFMVGELGNSYSITEWNEILKLGFASPSSCGQYANGVTHGRTAPFNQMLVEQYGNDPRLGDTAYLDVTSYERVGCDFRTERAHRHWLDEKRAQGFTKGPGAAVARPTDSAVAGAAEAPVPEILKDLRDFMRGCCYLCGGSDHTRNRCTHVVPDEIKNLAIYKKHPILYGAARKAKLVK